MLYESGENQFLEKKPTVLKNIQNVAEGVCS